MQLVVEQSFVAERPSVAERASVVEQFVVPSVAVVDFVRLRLLLLYVFFLRRSWLLLLMLCSFALYLAAALQLKDWFYHFLPAQAWIQK